ITATSYYNKKYVQIIKWLFNSKEDTNFTYELTNKNKLYVAQQISLVTKTDVNLILNYFKELEHDKALKNQIIKKINNSLWKNIADKEINYAKRLGWYAFARCLKPKVIIETGVDKGLGSIILCKALMENKKEGFSGMF